MQRCFDVYDCWDLPISSNGFCIVWTWTEKKYIMRSFRGYIGDGGADHGMFDIEVNACLLWIYTDFDRIVHASSKQKHRIIIISIRLATSE